MSNSLRPLVLAVLAWLGFPSFAIDAHAQDASPQGEQQVANEKKPLAGHSAHGEVFNDGPRQKAYLMGNTGKVSFPVTTEVPQAQEFFNQGVGQLHGFWYFEAERSFRQVAALDPNCAMAYWGMAMANRENLPRGKGFIAAAVQRKAAASPREVLWIEAFERFLADNPEAKDRRRRYVRDLESIIHGHPDDIEAKAFLAVQIWQNSNSELPIASHEAVDALVREVLDIEPMHPAHHYRIHLWDGEKPVRALPSAALCGQSAAGIAHMWHMPGHTYSKLQRYADAAWQQEASARVDHAHMIRDRVLPDQIHNYAHNNDWLVENLGYVGRVRDAIDLAKNMVELPRHPRYNTLDGSGSSKLGRKRLFELLTQYELWDELIELCGTPCLAPTEANDDQVRCLRALGSALIVTGDLAAGKSRIDELRALVDQVKTEQQAAADKAEAQARQENKPDDQVAKAKADALAAGAGPVERAEQALAELHARWAMAGGDFAGAVAHFERAGGIGKEVLSRAQLAAGNRDKAAQLAREAADQAANQVYPLANYVDVLARMGNKTEASEAFRRLQAISAHIDMQAPIFERLTAIAPELGLPADWRQPEMPAGDVGQRPDLQSLGPFRWHPSPAPQWSLTDAAGRQASLADFRGRPVVVIFYLGFGCLHCVEQLNALAPLAPEFEKSGISLLAISTDSIDALKSALAARQAAGSPLAVRLLSNSDLDVFKAYRAFDDFENMPLHATFLIDGDGLVRWQDISYEPFTDGRFLLEESKRLLGAK